MTQESVVIATYELDNVPQGEVKFAVRATSTEKATICIDYITVKEITGEVCEHVYVDGVCTLCEEEDPDAAYQAMIGETGYESVGAALAVAQSSETVVLKQHMEAAVVNVPSGVTLNLNGHTLTTNILLGFGEVIDQNAAGVDGQGGLVVGDATDTLIHLQETNSYLPIYDSTNACYKFYGYELALKDTGSETVYAVAIRFENLDAYTLINESDAAGLSLSFNLDLGDGTTFQLPYTATGIKSWAAEAYTYYSDSTNTKDMALTMTVTGAPEGATMTVALGAAFGVSSAVQ